MSNEVWMQSVIILGSSFGILVGILGFMAGVFEKNYVTVVLSVFNLVFFMACLIGVM